MTRANISNYLEENTPIKTNVKLSIHLTKSMFNPNISFDIDLPEADEILKYKLTDKADEQYRRKKQTIYHFTHTQFFF